MTLLKVILGLLTMRRRFGIHNFLPSVRVWGAIVMCSVALTARAGVELSILASFDGTNGSFSEGVLMQGMDGSFYGTTHFGGTNGSGAPSGNGYGNVFRVSTNGIITSLASFAKIDGSQPMAGLVQGSDGALYGTTHGEFSGPYSSGTVFKIETNGSLTNLVVFKNADGLNPQAALIQGSDGNLYGTTSGGGTNGGYGTVFKITTNGALTTLVSFANTNGGLPSARLLETGDGDFYGTTTIGGTNGGYGTVFKLSANGLLKTLVSFNNTNGYRPFAGLVLGDDGYLYGTTRDGGTNGSQGTVFKTSTNGVITRLVSFNGANGAQPYAELAKGSDGNFYGTTSRGGVNNLGTVFMITPSGILTTLVSFANTNGAYPYAGLTQISDGNLYGTTANGGARGKGTVFRFQMPVLMQASKDVDGALKVSWRAIVGKTYQVQFNSDLTSTNWNNLGSAITATNAAMAICDSIGSDLQRLYRVVLLY
jgi:uncharacterized repeat protein (TIGR03803 family)